MSDRLYARAASIHAYLSIFGAMGGAGAGAVMTVPAHDATFMMVGVVAGGAIGAVLGYALGMERAFLLRLQAQTIMVQVQIERNTRGAD